MNNKLISLFAELQTAADISGEVYRAKAFHNTIIALRNLGYEINADTINKFRRDLPAGIGKGNLERIEEFASARTIAEAAEVRNSPRMKTFSALVKIAGVGPTTAGKWMGVGVTGLPSLRRKIASGEIVLNHVQKYGLRYYDDLNERIPRAEVSAIGRHMLDLLRGDLDIIFTIAGSYRRGSLDSGDVDIIVGGASLTAFMERLSDDPHFIDVLSEGDERITFLYKSTKVRQIDILAPQGNYYAALLYFTGDWEFNEAMRAHAKTLGYRLNQNGLFKKAGRRYVEVQISSEQEIFAELGLKYIRPEDRIGASALN